MKLRCLLGLHIWSLHMTPTWPGAHGLQSVCALCGKRGVRC